MGFKVCWRRHHAAIDGSTAAPALPPPLALGDGGATDDEPPNDDMPDLRNRREEAIHLRAFEGEARTFRPTQTSVFGTLGCRWAAFGPRLIRDYYAQCFLGPGDAGLPCNLGGSAAAM